MHGHRSLGPVGEDGQSYSPFSEHYITWREVHLCKDGRKWLVEITDILMPAQPRTLLGISLHVVFSRVLVHLISVECRSTEDASDRRRRSSGELQSCVDHGETPTRAGLTPTPSADDVLVGSTIFRMRCQVSSFTSVYEIVSFPADRWCTAFYLVSVNS
jgi:hypothetical protein